MTLEQLLKTNTPTYISDGPGLVGYPDQSMQDDIYNWAISAANFDGKRVVDIGAGRGDIIKYLPASVVYTGIETNKLMCEFGTQRHNANMINTDYVGLDIDFGSFDIALCIGTLNSIKSDNPWETFSNFFWKMYNEITDRMIIIVNNESADEFFNSYPFSELFINVLSNAKIPFTIDYSRYEGIYRLVVFK